MPRIAYLMVALLVMGCAGMTEEGTGSSTTSQWKPPANRSELQVKRDRSECQRRGVSNADECLQSLGYSKQ
jgi:hypothetical protein